MNDRYIELKEVILIIKLIHIQNFKLKIANKNNVVINIPNDQDSQSDNDEKEILPPGFKKILSSIKYDCEHVKYNNDKFNTFIIDTKKSSSTDSVNSIDFHFSLKNTIIQNLIVI